MGFFENKNTPEYAIKQQMNAKVAFINQKYTEIGRYIKLNLSDKIENQDIKNMLTQIDKALEDLKVLTTNLNTVRGIKICPSCQREIPINNVFCQICGAKQPNMQNIQPQQPIYAQPAQAPIQQPAQQVQPVIQPQVQPQQIPQPVPVPVPAPQPVPTPAQEEVKPIIQETAAPITENPAPPMQSDTVVQTVFEEKPAENTASEQKFVFCTQCGNKEPENMKFCSSCGTPL